MQRLMRTYYVKSIFSLNETEFRTLQYTYERNIKKRERPTSGEESNTAPSEPTESSKIFPRYFGDTQLLLVHQYACSKIHA